MLHNLLLLESCIVGNNPIIPLKAFAAFVVASAEHIELTKSEIYNAAALFKKVPSSL